MPVAYDHSADEIARVDEAHVDPTLADVYAAATEAIDIIPEHVESNEVQKTTEVKAGEQKPRSD